MLEPRSSNDVAVEIAARKIADVAIWAGIGAPLVGVTLASYAAIGLPDGDGSNALVPFLLIAGSTFAPAIVLRAVTTRSVLLRLLVGQVVILGVLSLAAVGLTHDPMTQTIVVLAAVWIASIGGSVTGHLLGAAIAGRRA